MCLGGLPIGTPRQSALVVKRPYSGSNTRTFVVPIWPGGSLQGRHESLDRGAIPHASNQASLALRRAENAGVDRTNTVVQHDAYGAQSAPEHGIANDDRRDRQRPST